MANEKDLIKKLIKIAEKQQKIIERIAQQLPGSTDMVLQPGQESPMVTPPPPTDLKPTPALKSPAAAIIEALGDFYKTNISILEVHGSDIMVKFLPGKATQPNYDHILKVVKQLQFKNVLQGPSYNVKLVQ